MRSIALHGSREFQPIHQVGRYRRDIAFAIVEGRRLVDDPDASERSRRRVEKFLREKKTGALLRRVTTRTGA
jgi:CBS-domain-containing membrane protein